MITFHEYYQEYLGLEAKDLMAPVAIVISDYRNSLLNRQYLYPVIITSFRGTMVCSASPESLENCQRIFDGTIASAERLLDELKKCHHDFKLTKMRRYSLQIGVETLDSQAILLTPDLIRTMDFNLGADPEAYISQKALIFEDKRQFAVIVDNKIASTVFISDIQQNGCNIAVYTHPDYRNRGFGKESVKACINWCHMRNLLPIYLVDESNVASIGLAESLGMKLESAERGIMRVIEKV